MKIMMTRSKIRRRERGLGKVKIGGDDKTMGEGVGIERGRARF